jgi:ribonuclease HI
MMKIDSPTDFFDKTVNHGDLFTVRICFDGGTSCNVPSRGYGSYQIADLEIVRVKFDVPMSNNVAEVSTLVRAIESLPNEPSTTRLLIVGDSQIALNWASKAGNGIPYKPPRRRLGPHSQEFFSALMSLYRVLSGFSEVKIDWQPRERNVEVFGH